jgi:signal transduction histidine kinase
MNRHFKERFGELDGKAAHQLIHGCQEECKDCPTLKVFETRVSQEWEWAGPGGRIYQFYDHPLSDIDGAPMVLEMGIDITARKHAEQALRESETKLRFLTSQVLTAQEVERRRISKELHEELAQSLPTMKLHLKAIKDKLGREQQDLVAE